MLHFLLVNGGDYCYKKKERPGGAFPSITNYFLI